MRRSSSLAVLLVVLAACGGDEPLEGQTNIDAPDEVTVESSFEDGAEVPVEFTCEGEDVSPPLRWTSTQDSTEYALMVTDPDAPGGTFVHWVVYGIPGSVHALERGAVPEEANEGENTFGDTGYGGPCPPPGDDAHRYEFTVFALERAVGADLDSGAPAEEVLDALRPAVAEQGTLTGTYAR